MHHFGLERQTDNYHPLIYRIRSDLMMNAIAIKGIYY